MSKFKKPTREDDFMRGKISAIQDTQLLLREAMRSYSRSKIAVKAFETVISELQEIVDKYNSKMGQQ